MEQSAGKALQETTQPQSSWRKMTITDRGMQKGPPGCQAGEKKNCGPVSAFQMLGIGGAEPI